jgi:hypothetical protein
VLRVWFDDGTHGIQHLTPDQPITSAPYAIHALSAETAQSADVATTALSADDADLVGGVDAASLEESAEITASVAAHDSNAGAHANLAMDAAQIASGSLDLARIPQGPGSGLNADTVDGQQASAFMSASTDNWVNTNGDTMTGRLAINSSQAQPILEVTNTTFVPIRANTNCNNHGAVEGINSGPYGQGVYGEATSTTNDYSYGGYFVAQGPGARGVYGVANSEETMTKYGGYFWAKGGNGIGCRGEANGDGGKGVYGYATNEGDVTNYGGYFYARGTTGRGCYATGNAYAYYADSSGADYGPFTGAHEVRIAAGSPPILPGMAVTATGVTQVRTDEHGRPTLSSTLPEIALSATANDPTVLGVFVMESPLEEDHWYTPAEGERFGIVNALGEGRAWVCDANGPPRPGEYIATSEVPGYAQRQSDDLLHSYTLGKVTEAVDWSAVTQTVTHGDQTCKVYLIAVVYTSG